MLPIYSNLGFFDIPREDFIAQQAQLADLRNEHYQQLFESGAAVRILGSRALTNQFANKSTLTEGSVLYPFRNPQWNLSQMQSQPVYRDAGIERSADLLYDPLLPILGNRATKNYVLCMGRYEPHENGGSETSGLVAGLVFDKDSAASIGTEQYIPFAGIRVSDLRLIEQQLTEIGSVASEKGLGIIDPLTLSEGPGQVIGYRD